MLSAGMHRTEHRNRIALGASPIRSPMTVFTSHRINASWRDANCYRSGPDARSGLSLARAGHSFRSFQSRGQRSWPATSLPSARLHCPFGSTLRDRVRFAPDRRPLPCVYPVAAPCARFDWLLSDSNFPLGPLPPSGSPLEPAWPPLGPPSESARFPLAPRCCSYC